MVLRWTLWPFSCACPVSLALFTLTLILIINDRWRPAKYSQMRKDPAAAAAAAIEAPGGDSHSLLKLICGDMGL